MSDEKCPIINYISLWMSDPNAKVSMADPGTLTIPITSNQDEMTYTQNTDGKEINERARGYRPNTVIQAKWMNTVLNQVTAVCKGLTDALLQLSADNGDGGWDDLSNELTTLGVKGKNLGDLTFDSITNGNGSPEKPDVTSEVVKSLFIAILKSFKAKNYDSSGGEIKGEFDRVNSNLVDTKNAIQNAYAIPPAGYTNGASDENTNYSNLTYFVDDEGKWGEVNENASPSESSPYKFAMGHAVVTSYSHVEENAGTRRWQSHDLHEILSGRELKATGDVSFSGNGKVPFDIEAQDVISLPIEVNNLQRQITITSNLDDKTEPNPSYAGNTFFAIGFTDSDGASTSRTVDFAANDKWWNDGMATLRVAINLTDEYFRNSLFEILSNENYGVNADGEEFATSKHLTFTVAEEDSNTGLITIYANPKFTYND